MGTSKTENGGDGGTRTINKERLDPPKVGGRKGTRTINEERLDPPKVSGWDGTEKEKSPA